MRHRDLTLVLTTVVVMAIAAACSALTAAGPRSSPAASNQPSVGPASTAATTASAPDPSAASTSTGAPDRTLFLRLGAGTPADAVVAVSSATGHVLSRLPVGVADAGWSVLYAAVTAMGLTTVTAYDARSGSVLRTTSLAGSFALPVVVSGDLPGGLTSDGHTLVLVDQAPPSGSSRFAVVDTALAAPARFVTLPGDFAFDAVSPDARYLFLIEHVGQAGTGHYQVRAYDSATAALLEGAIVDKREIGEAMEGRPVARVTSANGQWVYTLYVKDDGTAFVHELDTSNAVALCVDLPGAARATTAADETAWRLALPGSGLPYAANGRLGIVVALDQGEIRASAKLPVTGGDPSDALAIAADGQSLYLSGPGGVTTLSTSGLVAVGQSPQTAVLDDLAVSPDGRSLFGLTTDGSGLVQLALAGAAVQSTTTVPFSVAAWGRVSTHLLAVVDGGGDEPGPSRSPSSATCEATRPSPVFTPPAGNAATPPDAYGSAWFGSANLWVMLDRDGEVWDASSLPHEHGFGNKTFWWSAAWIPGEEESPAITVFGTRLDGPGGFVVEGGTNATADFGTAMLVGVDFPTAGCWQLTGRYRGAELSYVVWLRDQ